MRKQSFRRIALIAFMILTWCVLSFSQPTGVAQSTGQQPFANSTEQRAEMIELLEELNTQLREQNELLRGGQLRAILADEP